MLAYELEVMEDAFIRFWGSFKHTRRGEIREAALAGTAAAFGVKRKTIIDDLGKMNRPPK